MFEFLSLSDAHCENLNPTKLGFWKLASCLWDILCFGSVCRADRFWVLSEEWNEEERTFQAGWMLLVFPLETCFYSRMLRGWCQTGLSSLLPMNGCKIIQMCYYSCILSNTELSILLFNFSPMFTALQYLYLWCGTAVEEKCDFVNSWSSGGKTGQRCAWWDQATNSIAAGINTDGISSVAVQVG